MLFGYFTLLVALIIETVGAYYSVTGLAAIFSGAVIPILIMGASLEVGKVTAAVWLKLNWERASIAYKIYLVPAVAFLMLLTSMGIFGFLSKAHSDQSLVSGDSVARVAIYDEKIKTAKDNIEANRRALKQMDEAVDQVMARSDDEKGADKAVAIRRSQTKERTRILAEIEVEQKKVFQLSEERAPLAAEYRKVENEVGPIKYIAALIYGDNPDANILERAVRWVIILIVAVFDPLALVLILAAQQSIRWAREEQEQQTYPTIADLDRDVGEPPTTEELQLQEEHRSGEITKDTQAEQSEGEPVTSQDPHPPGWMFTDPGEHPRDTLEYEQPQVEQEPSVEDKPPVDRYAYLQQPFVHFKDLKPMVARVEEFQAIQNELKITPISEMPDEFRVPQGAVETAIESEVSTQQPEPNILAVGVDVVDRPGDYIVEQEVSKFPKVPETAKRHKDPAPVIPEAVNVNKNFGLQADNVDGNQIKSDFGTKFPDSADKGDMFLRVDYLPNKLFKFNGQKWIEVDKSKTDSYTYDEQYIQFLIEKLQSGEYEIDQLSASEQELVAEKLQQIANDKLT